MTALHIWDLHAEDFVIAASPEDASAVMAERGLGTIDPREWVQWPSDVYFGRTDEDGVARNHVPADLIAARGRGFLAAVPV